MAAFVVSISSIGVGRILACTSVCLFDCTLGQAETVVPPGCVPLAGFPKRDCNVGGPVNKISNVGDGTKRIFFSTEVGEVHVG